MNRQQRRNAQRRGTFVDTETGMAAHGMGTAHQVRIKADLPEKTPGVHRWIASAASLAAGDGMIGRTYLEKGRPVTVLVENVGDKAAHGTLLRGSAVGNAKLTEADVLAMRRLHPGQSLSALAKRFGVGKSTVHDAVTGRQWSHLR